MKTKTTIKATKTVDPDLAKRIEPIRLKLAESTRVTHEIRYQIGMVVAEVRGERAPYAAGAMDQLEAAFGLDRNTLLRYQAVAETWSESAFLALLARKTENGQPLAWSHLELLATEEDGARREALTETAIAKELSYKELNKLTRNDTPAGDGDKLPVTIRQITNKVVEATRCVGRLDGLLRGGRDANPQELRAWIDEALPAYQAHLKAVEVLVGTMVAAQRAWEGPRPAAAAAM